MTTDKEIISKVWPNWEVKERLGKGSYGEVYHAIRQDSFMISEAAIKMISIPQDQSELETMKLENMNLDESIKSFESVKNDFIREIQIMQSLKSAPNIVMIEDYQVIDKENDIGWDILIRMELLTPFTEYIKGRIMTEKTVIQLGCDICTALEICNQKNIIHRDIKWENIFINEYGNYKLGDFGIARTFGNSTNNLSGKGTPNYMAPEIILRNGYDASVDIYSLGIVLYRTLNKNYFPFITDELRGNRDAKDYALDCRLRGGKLPAPCEASKEMANVILRACAYHKEYRFANATEFKKALQAVEDGTYKIVPIPEKAWEKDVSFVWPPVGSQSKKSKTMDEDPTEILDRDDGSEPTKWIGGNDNPAVETDAPGTGTSGNKGGGKDKPKKIWWLILALILLVGAAAITIPTLLKKDVETSDDAGKHTISTFSMPNLYGYTYEDAKKILLQLSAELEVVKAGEEYSAEKIGTVIEQYPRAGSDTLQNTTVKLTLSAGLEPTPAPTVASATPEPTVAPTVVPTNTPIPTVTPSPEPTATPTPTEIPHEHATVEVRETPAGCLEDGLREEICECGEVISSTIIPAVGKHTVVERSTKKKATVKEEGEWEEVCTVCKMVVNTGKIPKLTPTNTPKPTKAPTPTNTPKPTVAATPTPAGTKELTYVTSGKGVAVSGIKNKNLTEIEIPPEIEGKPVVGINENAFSGMTKLKKVKIPKSVTSIGKRAFYECTALTEIDIPEGVMTLGTRAFEKCSSVKTLKIPSTVTKIEEYCFMGMTSLTEVIYNAKSCKDYPTTRNPFYDAGNDAKGGFQVTIGEKVETLPAYFMCGDDIKLTSINCKKASKLKQIGDSAFESCMYLEAITIPESVTKIGKNAFKDTKGLKTIDFNAINCGNCPNTGVFTGAGKGSGITVTFGAKVERIPGYLFCPGGNPNASYPLITSVTIMGVTKEIGPSAFENCKALKSISMAILDGWIWKAGSIVMTGLEDPAKAAELLTKEYATSTWTKTK